MFIENFKEINKNILPIGEIFKCESKINLEKIKQIPNWNENDKNKIEKYFNEKLDNYKSKMLKIKEITTNYEKSEYSYDLECYHSIDYKLSYLMINIYCILYYFCSFSWIYLGIVAFFQLLKYTKNDDTIMNENMNEINDLKNLENDEDNKLILVNDRNENKEKYIELSQKSI